MAMIVCCEAGPDGGHAKQKLHVGFYDVLRR